MLCVLLGVAVKMRGGAASGALRGGGANVDPIAKFGIGGGESVVQAFAKGQQEIKPEAIALGVFGFIAGIAAILIAGLTIGRMVRRERPRCVPSRHWAPAPRWRCGPN